MDGRELQLSIIPQAIKKLYAKVAQLVEQQSKKGNLVKDFGRDCLYLGQCVLGSSPSLGFIIAG